MQHCIECGKLRFWSSTGKFVDGRRQMVCRNCGNVQLEVPSQGLKVCPKILYFDIETALMFSGLYDLYIPSKRVYREMIVQNSFVINWAAAWLDRDYRITGKIMSGVVTANEARRQDDKRIVKELWQLLEVADYWAGHNSNKFDIKKLKWRFLVHGLSFPLEGKKLDSYNMAVRESSPPSRGLEPLSLALGGKAKKGLELDEWKKIALTGTPAEEREKLLRKSDRYCRGDVKEGVNVFGIYARAIESSGRVVVR